MQEDKFVKEALDAAAEVLANPLLIRRGAALLYQVTVNNQLKVVVDPEEPTRGQSAFQTDLCVFEKISDADKKVELPRVVLEFKTRLTTHDVLTYSTKARKHKQVYPYLRYGLIIGNEKTVPGRFFTHNEGLDFCIAAATHKENGIHEFLKKLLHQEVESSRKLEEIIFGKKSVHTFRQAMDFQGDENKVI